VLIKGCIFGDSMSGSGPYLQHANDLFTIDPTLLPMGIEKVKDGTK
jgi:hypothetical protein